jgi:hypothetical protein
MSEGTGGRMTRPWSEVQPSDLERRPPGREREIR